MINLKTKLSKVFRRRAELDIEIVIDDIFRIIPTKEQFIIEHILERTLRERKIFTDKDIWFAVGVSKIEDILLTIDLISKQENGNFNLTDKGVLAKEIGGLTAYREYRRQQIGFLSHQRKVNHWLIVATIIAAVSPIFVELFKSFNLTTKKSQISELQNHTITSSKYLYGIPPSPPFNEVDVTISTDPREDCDILQDEITGYIIEVFKNRPYVDNELIIQDENGVRDEYYIDENTMSNAERSYLPLVLIPGNKVKMKVQSCGWSGDYRYVMKIKTLKRD